MFLIICLRDIIKALSVTINIFISLNLGFHGLFCVYVDAALGFLYHTDVVSIAVLRTDTVFMLRLDTLILKMEAARTSETLPTLTKSVWCKMPKAESTTLFWTFPSCLSVKSGTGVELVQL
jgi:hypothetical protein